MSAMLTYWAKRLIRTGEGHQWMIFHFDGSPCCWQQKEIECARNLGTMS